MMLNMDFTQRVVIDTHQQDWIASPLAGVWRKPLAREDAERGHATSIVRYEPGASFSAHNHPKGEEILVLEGVFSDETGDYPAGTHHFKGEQVALVRWPAGEKFLPHVHVGGEEIYVIRGEFIDEYGRYPAGTWIRSPHMSRHNPYVEQETLIWVKAGHL